jgi:membrane protease YdiL (CAAX protease family)
MSDSTQSTDQKHSSGWGIAAFICAVFLIAAFGPKFLAMNDAYNQARVNLGVDMLLLSHPLLRVAIVLVGYFILMACFKLKQEPTLGLTGKGAWFTKGTVLGLLCSLPMLLIGVLGGYDKPSWRYIYSSTLIAGLNEEFVFRAFGFGMLVQLTRVGLWPAAIFTGVVFGAIHLDFTPNEGETIIGQIDLFLLMTTLGGVLYAWLYNRSRFNLWFVIALHFFMNLWWAMFDMDGSFMGGFGATLSRVLCVTMAIMISLRLFPSESTIVHDTNASDSG